ncbi:DUF4097 family beta strand repeat-containing protein [Streptomyces sp. NPDC046985]|uniref:DUF4097 family beta strand repeat-containing protein n=1 Tax=Streptomyces sp. NPDC046985 TaxID=3155377 RepID=UPI0033F76831
MQKFDTPAPITAIVSLPAGRVQMIAADRVDTMVEILPANALKGRDVKAAEQVKAAYADGVLRIDGPTTRNRLIGSSGAVEVTVRLPAGSCVESKAGAAAFRGVGRLGDVVVEGGYRSVKLDETASARLSAHDGDIEVGRLGGPAEITTQRGHIRISEATGGTVTLSTQRGDISVGAARGVSASLDAGTSYGRVHNELRNDGVTALAVHATTSYGDITARSL